MAVSVSLQKLLNKTTSGDREHKFFSRSIQFLATSSGHRVKLQSWMITSLEVEFGREIGRGGLCVHLYLFVPVGLWQGRRLVDVYLRAGGMGGRLRSKFSEQMTGTFQHPRFVWSITLFTLPILTCASSGYLSWSWCQFHVIVCAGAASHYHDQTWSKLRHPHILGKFIILLSSSLHILKTK